MPYSIGPVEHPDTPFDLYQSAKQAALVWSAATGDVVVIRDDVTFQVVALVLGDVMFVPERNSNERTNQSGT